MDRRTTLKWVVAASVSWPLLDARGVGLRVPSQHGYGTDPDLSKNYSAGEPWPLTFKPTERQLAATLSDLIIPADEHSPSASAAGVVDFLDEWVSAPYADCQRDRGIMLGGFAWLDAETGRRFGRDFLELPAAAQMSLCEDICSESRAAAALREAAHFFARYRDLTAGGFYSSPVGRADLRYIGNVPLASFEGPPLALLQSLGLG